MKRAIFAAALLLAGCTGMDYAIEHYSDVDIKQFTYREQTFRIFDKPAESRMMITPSIGKAALEGLTFGGAATPEIIYQNAAREYLKSTGRKCTVSHPSLIVDPQFEIFYDC